MDDVLDGSARPRAPQRPLVCFDATNKAQHREVVEPLPVNEGERARFARTSARNGVSNVFMFFAPLEHWRYVKVPDHRASVDWAQCMQDLVDMHVPEAERIVVVMDNRSSVRSGSCIGRPRTLRRPRKTHATGS